MMAIKLQTKMLPVTALTVNEINPREIKHDQYQKLIQSIKDFPEMLNIRPIAIDENNVVLGGNMRFRACVEAGLKEVPTINIGHLSEEKKREFIIKDNLSYGVWDYNVLANEWDVAQLEDWGLNIPDVSDAVDYSALGDGDTDDKLKEMAEGVKKAIQIEFMPEHYEEAMELVKFWREQKLYIGGFLIEQLKAEKDKLGV